MRNYSIMVTVLGLLACSSSPQPDMPASLQETGKPALHAVTNERLRTLMAQMNALLFEQIRTEIELEEELRQKTFRIADAAAEIQQAADIILTIRPSLQLGQSDDATFAALAGKLKGQAEHLQDLARRNQVDALPEAVAQIQGTCVACHSLFRKY